MLLFTVPENDENKKDFPCTEPESTEEETECPEPLDVDGLASDTEEYDGEELPVYSPDERFVGLPKENIIELTYIESETVYQNKHIMLFDFFRISDKLTIKDCLIEICGGGFIGDFGKLYIEDCEILNPLQKLISGRFYEGEVKHSKIVFSNVYPSARVIACDDELLFEDCHFVNLNPRYSKIKAEFEIPPFINTPEATFRSCLFEDFSSFTEIRTGHILDCRFDRCTEVTCNESVKNCRFTKVECAVFGSEAVENCEFTGISSLFSEGGIKDCIFSETKAGSESPVITVKGGDITDCTFRKISGNGVLAKLLGGYVRNCKAEDVTESDFEKMFVGEKKGGFLGLKKISYSPFEE